MARMTKVELRKIRKRLRDNELELELELGDRETRKYLRRLVQQDRAAINRIERELAGRGR